ncbi:MAG: cyanophycinase [Anaerolineales bacterium]
MTTLVAIGGAINHKNPLVLREFLRLAGGADAQILILPQASALADTGEFYEKTFRELGARSAATLKVASRAEAEEPARLKAIRQASGIFIAGGNQMRLTALFDGTTALAALKQAFSGGTVVGGTSAGAAILASVSIAYGRGGPAPRAGMAQFLPGFGLSERVIFDQHFRQRDRLGRLLYAVACAPGRIGIGVDEDSAAIWQDDARLTVAGSGGVTLVMADSLSRSSASECESPAPVAFSHFHLHVLTAGCVFDRLSGEVILPAAPLLRE